MAEATNFASFGTDGFQTMGILNAMKTGDVYLDMLLAMCLPIILKIAFGWVGKLERALDLKRLLDWFYGDEPCESEHERFISYSSTRTSNGNERGLDTSTENSFLLKAVKLYLDRVIKLKLPIAYLDLMESEFGKEEGRSNTLVGILKRYKIINGLPENEWHYLGTFGNPPSSIRMRVERNQKKNEGGDKDESSSSVNNTTFHFKSPGEGAIDAFVETAYQWYLDQLEKDEDNSRYFYDMKNRGIDHDGRDKSPSFKRFKLSEEKSFDSLFFREKESLLNLIKHFTNKTGKYAIKGYPHKVGILLHGPPGTGKTSLIKAFAQETGRSIVNVPLSCVSTNSQLVSIFFDRKFQVDNNAGVDVELGFKDVIFVMEDVDAASNVVKRRDGRMGDGEPKQVDLPMPKSLWRMMVESNSDDCHQLVKRLCKLSTKLQEEALKPEILQNVNRPMAALPALGLVNQSFGDPAVASAFEQATRVAESIQSQQTKLDSILSAHAIRLTNLLNSGIKVADEFVDELLGDINTWNDLQAHEILSSSSSIKGNSSWSTLGDGSDHGEKEGPSKDISRSSNGGMPDEMGPGFWGKLNPDALSLSGLLNVLDGVVDTPGRIVIMTTNHPEMLDPALIRPGRVDKKIMLGYMASSDIVSMLEHCFQQKPLNTEVAEHVKRIVDGVDGAPRSQLRLTPAQIEQLAAEHDNLESMVDALEQLGEESRAPKRKFATTKGPEKRAKVV